MSSDTTTIRIGLGIGQLFFGSSMEQVRSYLGEPEELDESFEPESTSIDWSYPSIGVDAYFSSDDELVLGTLRIDHPDATLLGEKVIHRPEAYVRSLLEQLIGSPKEEVMHFSDSPSFVRLMFSEKSIEFWFKNEVLDSVIWSCAIDDQGEIVWPKS